MAFGYCGALAAHTRNRATVIIMAKKISKVLAVSLINLLLSAGPIGFRFLMYR